MNHLAWVLASCPVLLGAYTYVAYPAVLALLGQRMIPVPATTLDEWPLVTVALPAYNEELQIRGAIEALLAQDYPRDRLHILIISDASTDRTDSIVREYEGQGVELLRIPVRGGKTAAENASQAYLRGDIVVNTDASIRFHPTTVRRLVAGMRDPRVGVVSGRDVSVSAHELGANPAEAGYVGYEMWVRGLETRTGGIVGASGSGYAIRRVLHEVPVRDDLSRDFSAALVARQYGFVAISADEALCQVPRTASLRREYRRKVRTIARGSETLILHRDLLEPSRYGLFAFKLLSHKICRWLVPFSAIPGLVGLALLATRYGWAQLLLALVLVVLLLAAAGWRWPEERPMPRLVSIAAFGVAANVAVVHAFWRLVTGKHDHVWEPTRRAPVAAPVPGALPRDSM